MRAELSVGLGKGPSTAASLHRSGFAQVVGYFGPVGDEVCTRAQEALYRALGAGHTLLQAVAKARDVMSREYTSDNGRRYLFPLGWSQLATYQRGDDLPLAKPRDREIATSIAPPERYARRRIQMDGLPILEHGFIGRRALIYEIRRRLDRGQHLFVLQGPDGIGKTALASRLLTILVEHDADRLVVPMYGSGRWERIRERAEEHGHRHEFTDWATWVRELRESETEPVAGFERTIEALRAYRPRLVLYVDNMESLQQTYDSAATSGAANLAIVDWLEGCSVWWTALERLANRGIVLLSARHIWRGLSSDGWIPFDPLAKADVSHMLMSLPGLARLSYKTRRQITKHVDCIPGTLVALASLLKVRCSSPVSDSQAIARATVDELIASDPSQQITQDSVLKQLWASLEPTVQAQLRTLHELASPIPDNIAQATAEAIDDLIRIGLLVENPVAIREGGEWIHRRHWSLQNGLARWMAAQQEPGNSELVGLDGLYQKIGVLLRQSELARARNVVESLLAMLDKQLE